MIHCCDECAKERGYTMRSTIDDGPFGCSVCGRRNCNTLYSTSKSGWPGCVAIIIVGLLAWAAKYLFIDGAYWE